MKTPILKVDRQDIKGVLLDDASIMDRINMKLIFITESHMNVIAEKRFALNGLLKKQGEEIDTVLKKPIEDRLFNFCQFKLKCKFDQKEVPGYSIGNRLLRLKIPLDNCPLDKLSRKCSNPNLLT